MITVMIENTDNSVSVTAHAHDSAHVSSLCIRAEALYRAAIGEGGAEPPPSIVPAIQAAGEDLEVPF